MKSIITVTFILTSFFCSSQDKVMIRHADTLFIVTHTYTTVPDSIQDCDTCDYRYFNRIVSTIKDSVQVNKLTTSSIPNTAGFITPTALVPYVPKSDTATTVATAHKLKTKTDSVAVALSASTASSLALKQNTLVSGTTIKTVNGNNLLGSGDVVVSGAGLGYTLSVQALTSSPADAQTIYFGQLPKAPVTAAATSKIYIRKAGTIKMAQVYCYSGTAGTAEAWVMSIRLNNTTDTQIASVALGTSERIFTNSSLNIVVNAGDYIEIKAVNPTWVTNPLTTIMGGYIYIE